MNNFREIPIEEFGGNPFKMIGNDWMLIAAEHEGRVNAMTAAWGGMGVIWGVPAAYIFIRESRFTKELIDGSNMFSLTFFDHEKRHEMLGYMGSASGRNEDKIAHSQLTVAHSDGAPFFEEADTVFICKKLSRHTISPDGIMDAETLDKFYPNGDYHDMYMGRVVRLLERVR